MTEKAVFGVLCGGLTVFFFYYYYMHVQAVFGDLCGGLAIETSAGYARSLILPESPIVNCLGTYLAQEIAVFVFF